MTRPSGPFALNFGPKSSSPYEASEPLPLRIGILMDHPSPHMLSLLDALAACGDCSAEVLYFGKSDPERNWGEPVGSLPYRFLKGMTWSGGFRTNPAILKVLRGTKVDIWIVNSVYTSLTTLLAAWWLDRKKIPWVYMNEPARARGLIFSALKNVPLRFVLRRAGGIIGMGQKAEEMYRLLLTDGVPVCSIPYYIKLDDFYQLPAILNLQEKEQIEFLTVCQMIKRKGLDVLLHACKRLPHEGWQLTVVGKGPLRAQLERQFAHSWFNDRVKFVGEVPYKDRASIFAGKHVFILPSRWDGWGMVVPEALAAGLPVISTNGVISAHEFIRNGENGFIIPVDDPEALKEAMSWFIRNSSVIPEMGLAARESLRDYRPEVGAEKLVGFLSTILSERQEMLVEGLKSNTDASMSWRSLTTPRHLSGRLRFHGRRLIKNLVINAAVCVKRRRNANGSRILLYHLVLREDRQRFEDHVRFLSDHFLLCSVADVVRSASRGGKENSYRLAITFDDGFRVLMGDCLEVLDKIGVRGSFFVPTGFIASSHRPETAARFSLHAHYFNLPLEPMRPEDLKRLADSGHEVGSHGVSHISLRAMPKEMAKRELIESRARIAEWTGKAPVSFAYPYGDTKSSVGEPSNWLQEAGYEFGLTIQRGKVDRSSNRLLLPRDHAEGNWSIRDLKFFLLS